VAYLLTRDDFRYTDTDDESENGENGENGENESLA